MDKPSPILISLEGATVLLDEPGSILIAPYDREAQKKRGVFWAIIRMVPFLKKFGYQTAGFRSACHDISAGAVFHDFIADYNFQKGRKNDSGGIAHAPGNLTINAMGNGVYVIAKAKSEVE